MAQCDGSIERNHILPELPEVETIRRGLYPILVGARITKAQVNRPDLRWPLPKDMAMRLTGAWVTQLWRRSKYLLADLDTGETLLVHLGMSGRMVVSAPDVGLKGDDIVGTFHYHHPAPAKHDHVVIYTDAGARVTFNDARRFGAMDMIVTEQVNDHWLLSGMGPEPLSNAFNAAYLATRFKNRRTPVKSALLDQNIVAGLGNIYVCESLHRAGISPLRPAGKIVGDDLDRLVPAIRDVLTDAIAAGGSSLNDYRQVDGELGYFQHTFRAYGRAGAECPTPNCGGTIQRMVQSGRSSFYCPLCQR